ncbi:hypothetical protein [Streptomyces virginiae]|uniref:hypothetical protein n=1 Tax=Streptomyces virginiae TaxID=1961 RepID=UPI002252164B|nr:hypothetical protein [Streptomyces virginiae]MCX5174021.1 hypothetical protein [Streptomyces virginiae]
MENGRRAGRSWTGPKGPVVEINAVAELLHEYADTAGLSIKAVHEALTPEMLPAGTRVPDLRRMYDLMDGRDLSRAIAHAVIDVCSGLDGDPRLDEKRRRDVDALFEKAETAPTPVRAGVPMYGELVKAKDRLLALHHDLDNARQALQKSTAARNQAQMIMSTLLLVLAHQATTIGRLTAERDLLLARAGTPAGEQALLEDVERQLVRVRENEDRARTTLEQAERDRDAATAVAEEAGLLVRELQEEVAHLRATTQDQTTEETALPPTADIAVYDVDLTQTELTLDKAEVLLEQGREAVEEAGRAIGLDHPQPEPHTIPGQIIRSHPEPAPEFSGTTPYNPLTSTPTRTLTVPLDKLIFHPVAVFVVTTAVCVLLPLGIAGGLAADPGPAIWKWVLFTPLPTLLGVIACGIAFTELEPRIARVLRLMPPIVAIGLVIGLQMISNGSIGIAFIRKFGML